MLVGVLIIVIIFIMVIYKRKQPQWRPLYKNTLFANLNNINYKNVRWNSEKKNIYILVLCYIISSFTKKSTFF